MTLSGKVALVTGGSKGIGLGIAEALADAGAAVVITARGREALDLAAAALAKRGADVRAIPADVTDREQVKALRQEATQAFGRVDILVNNAGTSYVAPLLMADDEKWWAVVETNLRSTYLCTKTFLRDMVRAKSGRVINISSISGQLGAAFNGCYAASKAAVDGFTRSTALEVAASGVTVNAVCPGYVRTDLAQQTMGARARMFGMTADAYLDKLESEVPRHQLTSAEEVASAVVYLASPAAAAITGQTLNVCGGTALG
ncbi:MAG: glucose 1-dehydrogenase [Alphaproteobacteria bacterium]|nr:glucose 1-dehydrogenase [Alphaproteobacteria bacterium]